MSESVSPSLISCVFQCIYIESFSDKKVKAMTTVCIKYTHVHVRTHACIHEDRHNKRQIGRKTGFDF